MVGSQSEHSTSNENLFSTAIHQLLIQVSPCLGQEVKKPGYSNSDPETGPEGNVEPSLKGNRNYP